jgi:hypothetical protein
MGVTNKATGKPVAIGKPLLAPVLSGPRSRKPTAVMQALTKSLTEKRKRKATAALNSTPMHKARASPASSTTMASLSAGFARPRVATYDVVDEMTESQASAADIGVAEFIS